MGVLVQTRSRVVLAVLAGAVQRVVFVPLLDGDVTLQGVLVLARSRSGVALAALASTDVQDAPPRAHCVSTSAIRAGLTCASAAGGRKARVVRTAG